LIGRNSVGGSLGVRAGQGWEGMVDYGACRGQRLAETTEASGVEKRLPAGAPHQRMTSMTRSSVSTSPIQVGVPSVFRSVFSGPRGVTECQKANLYRPGSKGPKKCCDPVPSK